MALQFTPYHRFKNFQLLGSGDWINNTPLNALAGNFDGTTVEERLGNNTDDPANPARLYTPTVTSGDASDDTTFSSIIPTNATIIGIQFRYYYKWGSGTGLFQINPTLRIGSSGGYSSINNASVAISPSDTTSALKISNVDNAGLNITPSNIDNIEIGITFVEFFGTNPRVFMGGSGFTDESFEAAPSIRVQYDTNSATFHVLNTSKVSITGTSKLIVD